MVSYASETNKIWYCNEDMNFMGENSITVLASNYYKWDYINNELISLKYISKPHYINRNSKLLLCDQLIQYMTHAISFCSSVFNRHTQRNYHERRTQTLHLRWYRSPLKSPMVDPPPTGKGLIAIQAVNLSHQMRLHTNSIC